jgi:hypothetical protein
MDRFMLPPGLDRSTPRHVRLSGGGRALTTVALGLIVASFVVGIAMTRAAARQTDARRLFVSESATADAEILRLWKTSGDDGRHWAEYRFETPAGSVRGRGTVGTSQWRTLRVGSHVPVRYLRTDPSQSYLSGRGPRAMPPALPWVVASALAGGGFGVLWLVRIERRLLEYGRATAAVVTGHHTQRSSHGTHRSISYRFPLLSGANATGKSSTTRKAPAVGATIPLLYDPERPTRSRPYPLALVRLARD